LFIQPQRARNCDNKRNTNSAADALPLNLNLRRCCLIQQGCRPSSHPTSFSAEHESVTCLERIGKAGEKGMGQTNQELTFILAISSFSALVNLASICIRIENNVCMKKDAAPHTSLVSFATACARFSRSHWHSDSTCKN